MNPGLSVSLVSTQRQRRGHLRCGCAFGAAGGQTALAEGFVEHHRSGGGDVERADAAAHGNAQQVVAGAADQVVQPRALAAQHQNAVAGQIELVVVGLATLVEADDPEVAALELFQRADQIDHAGDAQVLGGAGAGLDRDRAQRRRTPLGEHARHPPPRRRPRATERPGSAGLPRRPEPAAGARRASGRVGSKRSSMVRNSCG
jgi:hypothetical protein